MFPFATAVTGMLHDSAMFPSRMTVHAPHWERPQPNFGPFNPRASRKTYSSGVLGSVSTTRDLPFTVSEICAMAGSLLDGPQARR
jgi:hypothetical protein